ncbi:MAG: hypothetical protein WCC12_23290, partial [Anaerolineales bacterium]
MDCLSLAITCCAPPDSSFALMIFYLFGLLYFLGRLNDGVIDGTILDALAAAGIIAFGRIDHTDLIKIIDCLALTKMNTGSTS